MNDLALISVFFNYENYESRKRNVNTFLEYIEKSGVTNHLYIAEILYKNQKPFIHHKNTIYLRCETPVWNKEAALNVLAKQLPSQYTKIMWVDMDIMWFNSNWYNDISKLLDNYKVIQPYSYCNYLTTKYEIENKAIGYIKHEMSEYVPQLGVSYGFALAHQREFYEKFGLFDKFILGGGDTILVIPPTGKFDRFEEKARGMCCYDIWAEVKDYFHKTEEYINGNYCFYDDEIVHLFHGRLKDRNPSIRIDLISSFKFYETIHKNHEGIYEIKTEKNHLKQQFTNYFKNRNEDIFQTIELIGKESYDVEKHKNVNFLWLSEQTSFKFNKSAKVKLYFSRNENQKTTKYLNIIYSYGKFIEQRIFDANGVLEIILDVNDSEIITFFGDYFIPKIIEKKSNDERKLSCILVKVEIDYGNGIYENYPLINL